MVDDREAVRRALRGKESALRDKTELLREALPTDRR
jgi:hypothetical protein